MVFVLSYDIVFRFGVRMIKIPQNLTLGDYVELLINNSNLREKDKRIIIEYILDLRKGCK